MGTKRLDSVKHLLWHGNDVEAQERQAALLLDLDLIRAHSVAAEKLAAGTSDFPRSQSDLRLQP